MRHIHPSHRVRLRPFCLGLALTSSLLVVAASAQTAAPKPTPATPPETHYLPAPSFDEGAMDPKVDPCSGFYKFACGNYAANNPIPADQTGVNQFHTVYNVDNQELNGILKSYASSDPDRTPNKQKIGDYYAACMNLDLIEKNGLTPLQPVLEKINKVTDGSKALVSVFDSFSKEPLRL